MYPQSLQTRGLSVYMSFPRKFRATLRPSSLVCKTNLASHPSDLFFCDKASSSSGQAPLHRLLEKLLDPAIFVARYTKSPVLLNALPARSRVMDT